MFKTASSASDSSSIQGGRKSSKLKFIKNVRPESFRRPSSLINQQALVEGQVATDQKDCTLVGYRKLEVSGSRSKPVELGTLSTPVTDDPLSTVAETVQVDGVIVELPGAPTATGASAVVGPHSMLYNAVSLPTLYTPGSKNDINVESKVVTGSMPTLAVELPLNAEEQLRRYWHCGPIDKIQSTSSSYDIQGSNGDQSALTIDTHDITICEATELYASGTALDRTLVTDANCAEFSSSVVLAENSTVDEFCMNSSGQVAKQGDVDNSALGGNTANASSLAGMKSFATCCAMPTEDDAKLPADVESICADRSDTDRSCESSPSMSTQMNEISRSVKRSSRCEGVDRLAEDSGTGSQSEISARSTDNHSIGEIGMDAQLDSSPPDASRRISDVCVSVSKPDSHLEVNNADRLANNNREEEFDDLDILMPVENEQYLMADYDESSVTQTGEPSSHAADVPYSVPEYVKTNQYSSDLNTVSKMQKEAEREPDAQSIVIGERLSRGGDANPSKSEPIFPPKLNAETARIGERLSRAGETANSRFGPVDHPKCNAQSAMIGERLSRSGEAGFSRSDPADRRKRSVESSMIAERLSRSGDPVVKPPSSAVSASIGERLSRTVDVPFTRSDPVDSEQYLTSQCTLLELIKEEDSRRRRENASTVISEGLSAGAVSGNLPELTHPINGLTLNDDLPSGSSSDELAETANDVAEQFDKRLVQVVRDETVKFIGAKEVLRKQLNYTGHFYR
jgi:hypothetical protein